MDGEGLRLRNKAAEGLDIVPGILARLVLLQLRKCKLSGGCFAKGGEIGDSARLAAFMLRAVFRWPWHQSDRQLKHATLMLQEYL